MHWRGNRLSWARCRRGGSSKCWGGNRNRCRNGFGRRRFEPRSRIGSTRFEFAQLVFKVPAHTGAIFALEVAQVFDARFEGSPLQLGITVGALHLALRFGQKAVSLSARLG